MKELQLQLNYCWAVIDSAKVRTEKQAHACNNDMLRAHLRGQAQAFAEAGAEVRKVVALSRKVPA